MKLLKIGPIVALSLVLGANAVAQPTQSVRSSGPTHTVHRWHKGPKRRGPNPMPRHDMAMIWGIPPPYTTMVNPLFSVPANIDKGAAVYADKCVACHGVEGRGDGAAGRTLSPPPGNLAWLSDMPIVYEDAFMYWTIAEGGAHFGTAMPAFKDTLSKDDIWAVTTYIRARFTQKPK